MDKFSSIDDYIKEANEFAKPILNYLRQIIHEACPEVVETIKWNFPHFLYKGKILCSMASFNQHAAFSFWLGSSMTDPYNLFQKGEDSGMGHFGKIHAIDELPDRSIIVEYIMEALLLIDQGKTNGNHRSKSAKVIEPPSYLIDALKKTTLAFDHYESLSQSHRNEYIEWIIDAKTEPTRQRRISQMTEWLLEGKSRNWKYER